MATTVAFPLIPGKPDVEFRFTIKTTRDLERAAGKGVSELVKAGQAVETLVYLTCYGLRWTLPRMTEDKAVDLVQDYIDNGGDVAELSKVLVEALTASGVYGKPEDADDGIEDPQTPAATQAATT